MNEKLKINNKLFSSGGVMGRLHYFINSLILSFFAMAVLIPLYYLTNPNSLTSFTENTSTILFVIPFLYLSIINMNKRIRDIRGSTHFEIIVNTALYLACSVPPISIIFSIFLLFKEGEITGNGKSPFMSFFYAYQEYNKAKNGMHDESPDAPAVAAKDTKKNESLSENEIQSIRDKFKNDAA